MTYDETKELKVNNMTENAHGDDEKQRDASSKNYVDPTKRDEMPNADDDSKSKKNIDQEINESHREGKYPSFDPEIAADDIANPFGTNQDPEKDKPRSDDERT